MFNLNDKSIGEDFEKGDCIGCGEPLSKKGWVNNKLTHEYCCIVCGTACYKRTERGIISLDYEVPDNDF